VVIDGNPSIPWNVIYDQPPGEKAFLTEADTSLEWWRPFWGIRYNLAAGRKVDPLRRMPAPAQPTVLLVVDPEIRRGLPAEQQQRLLKFARQPDLPPIVESRDQLAAALADARPNLLYWLSHGEPTALRLDGEPISPQHLFDLLEASASDDPERFPGLVFLNACQTAEAAGDAAAGSFLDRLYEVRVSGVIATEQQTIDTFASPFGLDFLEAFLDRGEPVGAVLQRLRGRVPLGLLYGTYCPPHLRKVAPPGAAAELPILQAPAAAGIPMGGEPRATVPPPPLPATPYRSLNWYDRGDRTLFAGREGDVLRFARILDEPATRLLVLHAESGVGKTSFLRAGVIPYLEEECVGYRFLRDHSAGEEQPALLVRATRDLAGEVADGLVKFCQAPLRLKPPTGQPVEIDLPAVLAGTPDVESLRTALLADAGLLGRVLASLGERLPYTPVLVINQAEEVFTLARTEEDTDLRKKALEMLRRAGETQGDFKVILSLRTEYYGRFIDSLRRGLHPTYGVREYLLTDLDEARLAEAIERPTRFPPYGFHYAPGMAREMARRIVDYCRNRQDSVLPLAQVICTQLYELVHARGGGEIQSVDLERMGGVEGGMRRHVEGLVARLFGGRVPAVRSHSGGDEDKPHVADFFRPFRSLIGLEKTDVGKFQHLFAGLYLQQPDGALTTALVPEEDVRRTWRGRMPFDALLQQASGDLRLLRVSALRLGGANQRLYVSLGHDALAKVADRWKKELNFGRRIQWIAAWGSVVLLVLGLMAGLTWYAWSERQESQKALRETKRQLALNFIERGVMLCKANDTSEGLLYLLRGFETGKEDQPVRAISRNLLGGWGGSLGICLRHQDTVRAVAFSPDGQTVLTGSYDNTARLWDAASGQPRGRPLLHEDAVFAVAFSPDGQTVLTGSHDKKSRRWNLPTVPDDPERIRLWIEVCTSRRWDDRGILVRLSYDEWLAARQRLDELGGPPITLGHSPHSK
jgi:hypothetical protein